MWQASRRSQKADPDFYAAISDLMSPVSRRLVFTTLILDIVLCSIALSTIWRTRPPSLPLLAVLFALICALVLNLIPKHPLIAHTLWLAGIAATIIMATYLLQNPAPTIFLTLLPLAAAIIVGWPGVLLAEAAIIGLVTWFARSQLLPPLPAGWGLAIATLGAIVGTFGWQAMCALVQTTEWSLESYGRAQQELKEARYHRQQLKEAQEDLILANRELARLSERLAVLNQVTEDARRAKEQFVANVSHELRTPLNMILGFSELILQSSDLYGIRLPPALLSDIAAIERNSQHLSKLVDDVLDLSQAEAGRTALSKEWVALEEIINEAATGVRVLFDSKGLYLRTQFPPDLPSVYCDRTRIRQVIINLLSNAGRFTEHGGVQISAHRGKDSLIVSVADTGPGITPEDQEKIFEPFYQLDGTTRRRHGGSGLGLVISKRFVEMHEGKMWLESKVGVGSTFHFSLPLVIAPSEEATDMDGARRWLTPYNGFEYRQRTRRFAAPVPVAIPHYILLDESQALQPQLARYLDDVEITDVHNVQQAIDELRRSPAHALIVNTPVPTEIPALLARLGDLPYGTPAVACWVPGSDAANRLGIVRYLVKPVSRQALLSAVHDAGEEIQSVLLVDDDWDALQLFSRMLATAPHSYKTLLARNGNQALEIMRAQMPHLVLLDLAMPGLDGFGVLREKAKDLSICNIPTIVVSAYDPSGDPAMSDVLMVTRKGGFALREIAACVEAISRILIASPQPLGREQTEKPLA